MRIAAIRVLFVVASLVLVSPALLADVVINGTTTFAALDGGPDDADHTVNGVFTVDGDLTVNGAITCLDSGGASSACAIRFAVGRDFVMNAGGALYAENRTGTGTGGAITITAGRDVILHGATATLAAAIISSAAQNSSSSVGGAIAINASGTTTLENGTTIDSGAVNAAAGSIAINAKFINVDGNVFAGPSRSVLTTRLTGRALGGGTANQGGGDIELVSSAVVQPAITIGSDANVISQGETGSTGRVLLDGCGIRINGLVAALADNAIAARVTLRSGMGIIIDARELGLASAPNGELGHVRVDAPSGTAAQHELDLFAVNDITILGPNATSLLFALSGLPGVQSSKSDGALVRVISLRGGVSAEGNVTDVGRTTSGDGGGTIDIEAAQQVTLDGAWLRAVGDSNTNNTNRNGGRITVRSFGAGVSWQNGIGDVTPTGSDVPAAISGSIAITSCTSTVVSGSSFPVNGAAVAPFPAIATGTCTPPAPSLPSTEPPLVICDLPPVPVPASATTLEDHSVIVTMTATDPEGDPIVFSIVTPPSNGSVGPITNGTPTSAQVTYTPAPDYNGTDAFTFQADDGKGGQATEIAAITITPVNDPPVFTAGPAASSLEDAGPQSVNPWASGIAPGPANEVGQSVTFIITSNSNPALFTAPPAVSPSGILTYTSAPNAFGTATISLVAHDDGGTANGGIDTSAPQTFAITVVPVNDPPSFTKGPDVTLQGPGPYAQPWATNISAGPNESDQIVTFTATAANPALFSVPPAVSSSGVLSFTPAPNAQGSTTVTVVAHDNGGTANGGIDTSAPQTFTITLLQALQIPPDPATVAPPIPMTGATDFASSVSFLYSGANPVQFNVAPGAIDNTRVAVLRGRVLDVSGAPIGGVKVSVVQGAAFGYTATRADGRYDIAVNGGSVVTIQFDNPGYMSAQRQARTDWRDFAAVDDVALVQYDTNVTPVTLGAAATQVARGSVVTDSDGTRQATVLFPPGVTASMTLADGTTQPLSTMSVRATEYTVGANGVVAMPAPLPPQSGYTYCVELSADEAVAAGASAINFTAPVPVYLENFLALPVGTAVPVGYYDRGKGVWVASKNGKVIQVLTVSGGVAQLDTNGDGVADDSTTLTTLGITPAEQQQIATLYAAGATLWRLPLNHFTTWDFNFPYAPPADAIAPSAAAPAVAKPCNCPSRQTGHSTVNVEEQALEENVPVAGTPFTLHYGSDRIPGAAADYNVTVFASGSTIPASLQRIDIQLEVAGNTVTTSLPAATNQTATLRWNGLDAYGRPVQGSRTGNISIGYVYPAIYQRGTLDQAFANFSGVPLGVNEARREFTIWQYQTVTIGGWDNRGLGLGGWSLDIQHAYDPLKGELYLGDGDRRLADAMGAVITTFAGTGATGFGGDGGPANQALLSRPHDVAVAPDGSIYIADYGNGRIRKVATNGVITTIAGGGTSTAEGIPATQARIVGPDGLDIGPDGTIYEAEAGAGRVRKIDPRGIISTIAGGGTVFGDGIPATTARLRDPVDVGVGADGSVYIADDSDARVRRVGLDGIISTLAGTGNYGTSPDGVVASQALLYYPQRVKVGADGSVYLVSNTSPGLVQRITPDGIMHRVAGNASYVGSTDDGVAALSYPSDYPTAIVLQKDALYFVEPNREKLLRVANGFITTSAGTGDPTTALGDNGSPLHARLTSPWGAAGAVDGTLYVTETYNSSRVRKISPPLPGLAPGEIAIPSDDASEAYVFDTSLRHVRTVDALTGVPIYTLGYDTTGQLGTITDWNGRVTTIQRANGVATAIIAPNGEQTTLEMGTEGMLASITTAAGPTSFTYYPGGLMATFTDPRQQLHSFQWDADGRLVKDSDPAGGFIQLARTQTSGTDYSVSTATAEGRTSLHQVSTLNNGDGQQIVTDRAGLKTTTTFRRDLTQSTTLPDGSVVTEQFGPDPRYAMQAPVETQATMTTPGGLVANVNSSRTATFGLNGNPSLLVSLAESTSVNGRTYQSTFDVASRTSTVLSPAGRKAISSLDAQGRLIATTFGNLAPMQLSYDSLGRLSTTQQGSRVVSFTYDAHDRVQSITDPLLRTVSFVYDDADRLTQQKLPDGRLIGFAYDANGNVTSVTPPGRPAHAFTYTPVDLAANYAPPISGATTYTYNKDRQLTTISRPGSSIALNYDSAGRIATITTDGGTNTYGYDANGRPASIATADNTIKYTYDGGFLTSTTWSGAVNAVVNFGYDSNFRLTSESAAGTTISFAYDADNLLTSAGALTLTRNGANGLLTGTALGSITDGWTYNDFAEPLSYSSSTGFSQQFTRDALGRITEKVETLFGTTTTYDYGYDNAGRLTQVTQNGTPATTYTYDSNGNRLTKNAESGTYDDEDHLLTYAGTTYTYAASGEVSSKTDATGTTTYSYDGLGNLRTVVLSDGRKIDYLIDGQNRRVGKLVNGTLVRQWVYGDQLRIIAELDGTGATVSRFVWGSRVNVPDYMIRGSSVYRIFSDHLGSPRLIVDGSGNTAQMIGYDEFGVVLSDSNPGFQPFAFAGGLYDPDTNLIQFGARNYDARVGRWTAKEPLIFAAGDSDFYTYATSDPINLIDIDGLRVYPAGFVGPIQPGDRIQTPADDAAAWALSHVGDPNYQRLSPNRESRGRLASPLGGRTAWKCNAFLWDALNGGGAAPGRMAGGRIPSASEWGSTTTPIPGYHVVPPGNPLQRGDVMSDGVHVAIYYPRGTTPQTISAVGWGPVVQNDWGFRRGQHPTVHRCNCAGK